MKKLFTLLISLTIVMALVSCTKANTVSVSGKFNDTIEATDDNGDTNLYYQFKSNDGKVWWILTEKEMGFVPDEGTEYVLTYNNNGTTKENKSCGCAPKLNCECEVYDDVFINIKERRSK